MHIEVVRDLQQLSALQGQWNAVYAEDASSHFFLSWTWMTRHLRRIGSSWRVLAVKARRKDEDYLAFLPIRFRKIEAKPEAVIEITLAGTPVADYAGVICRPQHERAVMAALATALKAFRAKIGCGQIRMENFAGPKDRLMALARHLSTDTWRGFFFSSINRSDGIDNSVCPFITLPGSWAEYLQTSVSSNTRQKLTRLLRQIEGSSEYQLGHSSRETVEEDLQSMLTFWEAKWQSRKGDAIGRMRQQAFITMMTCFEGGCLLLPTLRKNNRLVGALALFLDRDTKSVLFYMAGRDDAADLPSPGLALHAFSIRHAIENGFSKYDFMRGDEAYKFHFTSERARLHSVLIRPAPADASPRSSDQDAVPAGEQLALS
jgi:CelD/BcsL family acetyltransferase involved in cellulose biosynthesis